MECPLVSALMPTCDRRGFIPRAVRCFLSQDYPNLELVVLDDGADPIRDLLPSDPRIKYFYEMPKKNHGTKMNRCMELAQGEFGIVWDDDDLYSSNRVSLQIQPMIDNPILQLTGTSTFYTYEHGVQNPKAWQYTSPKNIGWLASIAFRKSFWEKYKFDHVVAGADYIFQIKPSAKARLDLMNPALIVAAVHPNNTCQKRTDRNNYKPIPWGTIQQLMGATA